MHLHDLLHPLIVPLPPLLAGIAARLFPATAQRLVPGSAALAAGLAVAFAAGPWTTATGIARLDFLAATMSVLAAVLGCVIQRYATRYLEGDPCRPRFLSWMALTLAAVLVMVTSNHLLLLFVAWVATSLCLHRLLLHHPGRPAAVFAARKKFVFSRSAELLLLSAVVLLHQGHGTWRIDELIGSIEGGNHAGLPAAAVLLALCAMLKSAQFPFHSWLPDTMDTPTPVSAFMHAGIINGGGFLVLRLAPVFAAAPVAMQLLAAVGTITAVFGAIVMLAQPGVKRALAFSTIAQMGFMMIQCGLGAWGLALLHLVAHSLYKAHAFLHAGSTVGAPSRAAIPLTTPALATGLVAAAAVVATASAMLKPLAPSGIPAVFPLILALGLAYGIARASSGHRSSRGRAILAAAGVAILALALHTGALRLMAGPLAPPTPVWLTAMIAMAFLALFLFQALLWRASGHPIGRSLYVHALNGFYVSTLANRLLGRLWPSQTSR